MSQGNFPPPPPPPPGAYGGPGQGGMYPPPRQGMPTWAKVLLALGVTAGIGMVLCCGVMGVVMYGGYKMAAEAVSTDPQVVVQRANEIAKMEMLDGYQPKFSINMRVPVTDKTLAKCAGFTRESVHGLLLLGQVSRDVVSDNPEAIYMHLQTFLDPGQHSGDMEIDSREEREFTVRGQAAKFEIARGKVHDTGSQGDSDEPVEFVRMLGSFPGAGDEPALLMLFVKANEFDEAAAEKMLASIQ